MSSNTSYRAVCPLCQTVIVSSMKDGAFIDFGMAVKAMHGHLNFSCPQANGMSQRKRELIAENGVEVCEGAA